MSSVSNVAIIRAVSGAALMFWPSMKSLEPPPVTPTRKLPPRLGVELVVVPAGEVPQAARMPATDRPPASAPAPIRSSRRETDLPRSSSGRLDFSSMSCPPKSRVDPVSRLEPGCGCVPFCGTPVHCPRECKPARHQCQERPEPAEGACGLGLQAQCPETSEVAGDAGPGILSIHELVNAGALEAATLECAEELREIHFSAADGGVCPPMAPCVARVGDLEHRRRSGNRERNVLSAVDVG